MTFYSLWRLLERSYCMSVLWKVEDCDISHSLVMATVRLTVLCVRLIRNPFIPKEECISHVTKRMGTGLRTLLKDFEGKNLLYSSNTLLTSTMLKILSVQKWLIINYCIIWYKRESPRHYSDICGTVEPPTDTSHRWTPLVSRHLVMFPATYRHPQADTFSGPGVPAYRRFSCIHCLKSLSDAYQVIIPGNYLALKIQVMYCMVYKPWNLVQKY